MNNLNDTDTDTLMRTVATATNSTILYANIITSYAKSLVFLAYEVFVKTTIEDTNIIASIKNIITTLLGSINNLIAETDTACEAVVKVQSKPRINPGAIAAAAVTTTKAVRTAAIQVNNVIKSDVFQTFLLSVNTKALIFNITEQITRIESAIIDATDAAEIFYSPTIQSTLSDAIIKIITNSANTLVNADNIVLHATTFSTFVDLIIGTHSMTANAVITIRESINNLIIATKTARLAIAKVHSTYELDPVVEAAVIADALETVNAVTAVGIAANVVDTAVKNEVSQVCLTHAIAKTITFNITKKVALIKTGATDMHLKLLYCFAVRPYKAR